MLRTSYPRHMTRIRGVPDRHLPLTDLTSPSLPPSWMCVFKLCSRVALCSLFFVRERGHERPIVQGCRDARAVFLAGLCACVCVSACVM